jgi:MoaA/NifB/PqqE/SkfB family radical SAM enzyme
VTVEMTDTTTATSDQGTRVSFLWLEITGKCQLACEHCYADSGPTGSHGSMTSAAWMRVIQEAAQLGIEMVQFIGGEPTLHPEFDALVRHALASGLNVEVYTNLIRVTPEQWALFELPGVQLATSYYSDDASEHESITGRRGSHRQTLDGIAEALRRDIPLRVGLIRTRNGQHVDEACHQLAELGVIDVKVDHLRQVGRGIRDREAAMDQLCGNCASGVLAVSPSGEVWPCVFARWMSVGNVRDAGGLRGVSTCAALSAVRAELRGEFESRRQSTEPVACKPHGTCGPCSPTCVP